MLFKATPDNTLENINTDTPIKLSDKNNKLKRQESKNETFSVLNAIVEHPNISANAVGVVTYLCSRGKAWIPRVKEIRTKFNLGERIWLKIAKELRELNIISYTKTKDGMTLNFHPSL